MQTTQRRIDPGVIGRILDEPQKFEFFQLVRMLEIWSALQTPTAADTTRTVHTREVFSRRIGFRNTLSLSFPPSEVAHAQAYDAAGMLLKDHAQRIMAMSGGSFERVELTPAFFGLLGGQGALPLHYTEQIVAHEQMTRDHSARTFLDALGNRATALFYAAWKKNRLLFHYELDREDRYLPALLSLAGVADRGTRENLQDGQGALTDEVTAGHAPAVRHRPMSAAYLRRILAGYFRVPVRVEQFVGRWCDLPRGQLTQPGRMNATLGSTTLVGERIWQRNIRIRLVIGPLSKHDYENFLPGSDRALALKRFLVLLSGATLEYEVSLVLRRSEVGTACLGAGARLGWDAFLRTQEECRDRTELRYELHVMGDSDDAEA